MTLELVHRPTRVTESLPPPAPELLAPPPATADPRAGGFQSYALLPVLSGLSAGVMVIVFRHSNPVFLVIGAVVVVVALVGGLAMALSQRGGAARQRRTEREGYLDYLERLRTRLAERATELRRTARLLDPDPYALLDLVRDPARLWERRRRHADFLAVRVGLGDRELMALTVPPEQNPVQPYEPLLLAEAEATAAQGGWVRDVPVPVRLDGAGHVALVGDRATTLGIARSLLLQLAALHAPEDVGVALAFPPAAAPDWSGADLLPHLVDPRHDDGPVPGRRIAPDPAALGVLLAPELRERTERVAGHWRGMLGHPTPSRGSVDQRRLVVVLDHVGAVAAPLPLPDPEFGPAALGVTVLHLVSDRLHEPPEVTVRLTATDSGVTELTDARDVGAPPVRIRPDLVSAPVFAAVARTLTSRRLSLTGADAVEAADQLDVTELLGLRDLGALSPETAWRPRSPGEFLRVPIGLDDLGAPVIVDLKESAQLGMGPHGICVGATGSGKSELLRTLLTSLTTSHPPEDLSLVLVDYKGGAAFAPFAELPHVAGLIDNLAEDAQLTERARASIRGEVIRRQQLLKAAGSSPSITHYRELRARAGSANGGGLPNLPHLLIVIDEFSELLTADPEFVDLLITIGRIGRSIGVHLLLCSQRVDVGKLRGLETYLSYRIGLRTFSESESSMILETKDAFHLPPAPGFGYLKVDTTLCRRFRSGFVSGPLTGVQRRAAAPPAPPRAMLQPVYNGLAAPDAELRPPAALTAPELGRTLVAECVDRLRAPARRVRPVWLDPLPARLGLVEADRPASALAVPLGLIDHPAQQRQEPWRLDLARGGGHVAVIGAPQSGRSTLLRTLAVSAALTHTPRQLSLYGMDLSGGGLLRIAGFPHVGGVATRAQPERLLRMLEELLGMLAIRERIFAEHRIDSIEQLRVAHAAGRVPELVSPDVVLLVDGFAPLRNELEPLEEPLLRLLQAGSSFGVHVVLAMTRWNDLRMAQQPLVGTRLELRLNDPIDSVVNRKLAALLRPDQPGRLLTEEGLFAQVALPVLALEGCGDVGGEVERLAERVRGDWAGPTAAPIRMLPTTLAPEEVPEEVPAAAGLASGAVVSVPLGLRQDTMGAACLELGGRDQHLIAFGDPHAGKTTLLRGIVSGLGAQLGPEEVVFAVMDLRGDLAPCVPDAYLGAHATSATLARGLAESVAAELAERVGGGAHAAHRRIVVLVDDYDIVAAGGTDPLRPLLRFLPSARDLGLHLVLTRPVAGASRAMYDAVLQTVRDTGGSLLIMSGDRSEGPLLPRLYAEPLPPGRGRFVRRGEPPHLVQIAQHQSARRPVDHGV